MRRRSCGLVRRLVPTSSDRRLCHEVAMVLWGKGVTVILGAHGRGAPLHGGKGIVFCGRGGGGFLWVRFWSAGKGWVECWGIPGTADKWAVAWGWLPLAVEQGHRPLGGRQVTSRNTLLRADSIKKHPIIPPRLDPESGQVRGARQNQRLPSPGMWLLLTRNQ